MIVREQVQVRKNEETVAQLKQLLAKKDLETRDKLQQEGEKERKVAKEAEERAAVSLRCHAHANNFQMFRHQTRCFLCFTES